MELVKCFFLFLFLEENRKLKDIIVFFFFFSNFPFGLHRIEVTNSHSSCLSILVVIIFSLMSLIL